VGRPLLPAHVAARFVFPQPVGCSWLLPARPAVIPDPRLPSDLLDLAVQLEAEKARLDVVTAMHVYSVQPGVPKDASDLYNADYAQTQQLFARLLASSAGGWPRERRADGAGNTGSNKGAWRACGARSASQRSRPHRLLSAGVRPLAASSCDRCCWLACR
jgi:hypothetical protein